MTDTGPQIRCGYLQKYSKGMMGSKWKSVYVVLYKDGSLFWFKAKSDPTSKGNVSLKKVCDYLAVGANCRAIPYSPELPSGGKIDFMIAFPQEPVKKSKVHFLLCENEQELNDWMTSISSVLPSPPASVTSQIQPSQASATANPPAAPGYYANAPTTQPGAPPIQPQAPPVQPQAPPIQPQGHPPGGPPTLGFDALGGSQPPAYSPHPPPQAPYPPHQPPPQPAYPPQPYPTQQQQYPYPTQGYAQQPQTYPQPPPSYPQQPGAYPQQPPAYPQGYPQQTQPYPRQPSPGPQHQGYAGYPQQQATYPQQQQVGVAPPTQTHTTVIVKEKSSNKGLGKMAAGLVGGAAIGYVAGQALAPHYGYHHGPSWGGGWGMGHGWGHGSWSSFSWSGSFSGGSFGSFGGYD